MSKRLKLTLLVVPPLLAIAALAAVAWASVRRVDAEVEREECLAICNKPFDENDLIKELETTEESKTTDEPEYDCLGRHPEAKWGDRCKEFSTARYDLIGFLVSGASASSGWEVRRCGRSQKWHPAKRRQGASDSTARPRKEWPDWLQCW